MESLIDVNFGPFTSLRVTSQKRLDLRSPNEGTCSVSDFGFNGSKVKATRLESVQVPVYTASPHFIYTHLMARLYSADHAPLFSLVFSAVDLLIYGTFIILWMSVDVAISGCVNS